jgi:hypothetical protein
MSSERIEGYDHAIRNDCIAEECVDGSRSEAVGRRGDQNPAAPVRNGPVALHELDAPPVLVVLTVENRTAEQ